MKKIELDLDLLKIIMNQESKKLVGTCMKRFEISDNKEEIKKQVKELIYESFRNLSDFFENGQILFTNQSMEKKE
jgi:protein associated with RNAse G/E